MTQAPNLFIIGAARAGSTFLARHLDRHPEIGLTDPKESHFLALGGAPPAFDGPGDDATINDVIVWQRSAYQALFAPIAGLRYRLDASVSTMYRPDDAIPRIDSFTDDPKLIVSLRDPLDRAFSAHQYLTGRGFEDRPFGEALRHEFEGGRSSWHHLWHLVGMSSYGVQLASFVEHYGRHRILILDFSRISTEPANLLSEVTDFLDLGSLPEVDEFRRLNQSGQARFGSIGDAITAVRRSGPGKAVSRRLLTDSTKQRLRELLLTEKDEMPTIDQLPEKPRQKLAADLDLLRSLWPEMPLSWSDNLRC